jgi:probable HAF family extracellular repeat protein
MEGASALRLLTQITHPTRKRISLDFPERLRSLSKLGKSTQPKGDEMRTQRRFSPYGLAATVSLAVLYAASATAIAAASYSVTDLGILPGYNSSDASDITSAGVVVGGSWIEGQSDNGGWYYSGGGLHNVGTLGGMNTIAMGVNDTGQIVGSSNPAGNPANNTHAFLYDSGSMRDLGTLGGSTSVAYRINNNGAAVGYSTMPGDSTYHPFYYSGGAMHDMGTLGGTDGRANDINDSGQIVGGARDASNGGFLAFLYRGSTMQSLGTLGGSSSEAFGINSAGQIVGSAYLPGDVFQHCFLYSGGAMHDLGSLDPNTSSVGRAINSTGEIVGYGGVANHGFVYSSGVFSDLNSLIDPASGWLIGAAYDLNDAGQIIGEGYVPSDDYAYKHAYLLTPVPEPTSLLLVALGSFALGGSVIRRWARVRLD